jgi:chaperonin GroES
MLKPLNDHVIVKPLKDEQKTESGIIIPDTVNKEKPEKGEIIATGPGKLSDSGQRVPLDVKVGDKIVFTKYSPSEVKFNNETYLVLTESDILAVIEEEVK